MSTSVLRVVGGSTKRVQSQSVAQSYFDAWAGKFVFPTLLLTLDLKILWANRAALDLMDQADDFADINGYFVCMDKAQGAEFREFVEAVEERDAWVYQGADDRHTILRCEALQPEGELPGVAVMLVDAQSDRRFMWADLSKAFGLTKAESVVARRLVGGAGAEAVADSLGVSIETVRTHIRRLYGKLSVNSREKLINAISRFRLS